MSLLGSIMLIGIVVKNGCLLYTSHTCIPVVQAVQCVLYRPEEYSEHLGLFTLQAVQLRTEHRLQRQSRNGGYKHNGAHHPAQLLEQHAGHTGYHGQREEYGNHRQRRSRCV